MPLQVKDQPSPETDSSLALNILKFLTSLKHKVKTMVFMRQRQGCHHRPK